MISLEASPIMSTKQKESKKDQRQFWQMAIETWQSSGLSIRRFCKQEGLSEPSFYAWRKRLPQVDESDADKEAVCQSEPFIQVSLPTEKHGGLELVLSSGHILRISSPADTQTLTTVLSALCEVGLC
jgi:transposase